MSKGLVIAVSMVVLGWAGIASAEQGEAPRHAVIQGRQVVWQSAQAERPYALTGERATAQKDDESFQLRAAGRSGFVRVAR